MTYSGYNPAQYKADLSYFQTAFNQLGNAVNMIPEIKAQKDAIRYNERMNEEEHEGFDRMAQDMSKNKGIRTKFFKDQGLDPASDQYLVELGKTTGLDAVGMAQKGISTEEIEQMGMHQFVMNNVYTPYDVVKTGREGSEKTRFIEDTQAYIGRNSQRFNEFFSPYIDEMWIQDDAASLATLTQYSGENRLDMDSQQLSSMTRDAKQMERLKSDETASGYLKIPETIGSLQGKDAVDALQGLPTQSEVTDYFKQNKYDGSERVQSALQQRAAEYFPTVSKAMTDGYTEGISDSVAELVSSKDASGRFTKQDMLEASALTFNQFLDSTGSRKHYIQLPKTEQDRLEADFKQTKQEFVDMAKFLFQQDTAVLGRSSGGGAGSKADDRRFDMLKFMGQSFNTTIENADKQLIDLQDQRKTLNGQLKTTKGKERDEITEQIKEIDKQITAATSTKEAATINREKVFQGMETLTSTKVDRDTDRADVQRIREDVATLKDDAAQFMKDNKKTTLTKDEWLPIVQGYAGARGVLPKDVIVEDVVTERQGVKGDIVGKQAVITFADGSKEILNLEGKTKRQSQIDDIKHARATKELSREAGRTAGVYAEARGEYYKTPEYWQSKTQSDIEKDIKDFDEKGTFFSMEFAPESYKKKISESVKGIRKAREGSSIGVTLSGGL